MTTNKRLRTPLIKPRTQGGSFYTFGSAIEDIGLNINEKSNKVELTHYALLDIPAFSKESMFANGSYNGNMAGDMIFAESFQNYALNLETIVRNQDSYNFAINKTCSEKIFWKWLFKITGKTAESFTQTSDGKYYIENDPIVKCFGQISAGAQRTDDFGIYNETFVQIPSSYGQMICLFKKDPDDNYNSLTTNYQASNIIENITTDEYNSDKDIITTGINCQSIVDDDYNLTYDIDDTSMFSLELNINKLREYYGENSLTYDDLGFGTSIENTYNRENSPSCFNFNAVLVYYSIFDANNNDVLSTNLYGIYVIDKSQEDNDSTNITGHNYTDTTYYKFPTLQKRKTTQNETGTSFSFRLNIKTTSAYSGDIQIIDNSTAAYAMGTDFNDILRNLNSAIRTLSSNAKLMYDLAKSNKAIQQLAAQAIDKVEDLETTINSLKNDNTQNEMIMLKSPTPSYTSHEFNKDTALSILSIANTTFDFKNGKASLQFPDNLLQTLPQNAQNICRSLSSNIQGTEYFDTFKLLTLIITAIK